MGFDDQDVREFRRELGGLRVDVTRLDQRLDEAFRRLDRIEGKVNGITRISSAGRWQFYAAIVVAFLGLIGAVMTGLFQ